MIRVWRLGPYQVELDARRVLRDGQPMALGSRAFNLLAALIEQQGEVVSKDDLLAAGWPGLVVEENNLTVQIAGLRKVLGDLSLATVPGRGYQLAQAEPIHKGLLEGASVAVLPFLATPADDVLMALGLTEELISALGRFRSLRVIARNSSFDASRRGGDVRKISAELNARFIVEGSTRRVGNDVRVLARLLDGSVDRQLWSASFDGLIASVFQIQEQIAGAIASAVQPQVDFAERASIPKGPEVSSAYAIALQAWACLRRHDDPDDFGRRERARSLAREALACDPASSLAARTLAWAQFSELWLARTPVNVAGARESIALLSNLLAADPFDNHAFHFRGLLHFLLGDHAGGIQDLRQAHELNPNDPATMAFLGYFESTCGSPDRGVPLAEAALRLSPRDPQGYLLRNQLAACYFAAGDVFKAYHQAHKAMTDAPWFPAPWLWIAITSVQLSEPARAIDAVRTLRTLAPAYLQQRLDGQWMGSSLEYRQRATRLIREAAALGGF